MDEAEVDKLVKEAEAKKDEDKKKKESIMSKNLECDFSIQRCAKSYYKVYKEVVYEVSS